MLVIGPNLDPAKLYSPSTNMPVWVVDSPTIRKRIEEIRAVSEGSPISEFTIFNSSNFVADPIDLTLLLQVLAAHYPFLTRLNVMGTEGSSALLENLEQSGYNCAKQMWPDTTAFKRPLPRELDVPKLTLHAKDWKTPNDVFDSLFAVLKSPVWHGRNFNALNDSIVTGDINSVEVPYQLVVRDLDHSSMEAQTFANELVHLIGEFEDWGCPVSMKIAS